jgi:hypothetical protein
MENKSMFAKGLFDSNRLLQESKPNDDISALSGQFAKLSTCTRVLPNPIPH